MMLKKIPVERLRRGMYVHEICGDWMSHPFWRSSFVLSDPRDVRRMLDAGVREVYIDTARGPDDVQARPAAEVREEVQQQIVAALSTTEEPPRQVELDEELTRARSVHAQASRVVRRMMHDVRLGKAISLDNVEPVVEAVTDSILRNSSALLGLIGIKDKDDYTFQHSVSVCTLMITFGRARGMAGEELKQAGIGGLLHDIGKMKVPDAVLNKPGRLTDAEFELIKRHPGDGHAILLETRGVGEVPLEITRHHHERIDGSGYPDRLAGGRIGTMARMAAIVDVYDAITAERCYHKGMHATEALRKMWEWSKNHFDPQLLSAFMRCIGIYPIGSLVRLASGRLGVVVEQTPEAVLKPVVRVFFSARANAYIEPELVDLAAPGSSDTIVADEAPEKWRLDPRRFLDRPAS